MSETPNMHLVLPDVLVTTGPQWATDLNAALALVDSHNHSTGQGVKITPSGLNISSDLSVQLNNITNIKTTRFNNYTEFIPGINDLNCFFVRGGNIFYIDSSGNEIQITSNGGLNLSVVSLLLDDDKFFLRNAADNTKEFRFSAGSLLPETTNIYSLPPIDSADSLVTNSSDSFLSNKQLSANECSVVDTTIPSKYMVFDLGDAAATKKTTLKFVQTDNRVLTFPDITDTLVSLNSEDILQNKTMVDSNFAIFSELAPIRALKFDLSSSTPDTTTTIYTDNLGGDVGIALPQSTCRLIGDTTSDTLTNKKLSDSTNSFANVVDATKELFVSLGSATTGKKTTLNFVQTDNRVITFPDATCTLSSTDSSDLLNNKSLVDSTCQFVNVADNSKQFKVSLGGSSPSTATTFLFAQNANRVLTFPNLTDTMVSRTSLDTLSNKNLIDDDCYIIGDSDPTKRLNFSVDTSLTNTTTILEVFSSADRTLTLPDADTTLVGVDTIDNLQNKSLEDTSTTIYNAITPSKRMGFNLASSTTGTTTLFRFFQTANRNIDFPDASTILVGKNTTDNLQNKSLEDLTTLLYNSSTPSKQVGWDISSATSSTKSTLRFFQTANRNIDFPDASTVLVGRSTTDSLTNKSLVDANCSFVDDGDATKKLSFSLGGGATAVTMTVVSSPTVARVLTLPDVTDTLVGKTTTDVLTNKTLDAALATTSFTMRAQAGIAFNNSANTFATTLRAGTNLANVTFQLPIADGSSGNILATDGAGNLSFTGSPSLANITVATQITNNGGAQKDKDVAVNSSTAYTIDPANGTSFRITLNTATPALTLAANPAANVGQVLSVQLIQDGTGNRLPGWTNVARWAAVNPPTISSTAGSYTFLMFIGTSDGWVGFAVPQISDLVTFGGLTVTGAGLTALKGVTAGTNVAAGNIGEVISGSLAQGSAVSLTSTVIADVLSIVLTAGDWDISGSICFSGGAIIGTQSQGFVGTATGNNSTGRDLAVNTAQLPTTASAAADVNIPIPTHRVNISSGGTYYLKAVSTFSMGTATAYGSLRARRSA